MSDYWLTFWPVSLSLSKGSAMVSDPLVNYWADDHLWIWGKYFQ